MARQNTLVRWLRSEPIVKRLIPKYDEISLYLTSVTYLLLIATLDQNGVPFEMEINAGSVVVLVISLVVIFGLPIAHVFLRRRKNQLEKILLLLFAVTANGIAAFAGARYVLKDSAGWFAIFPAINMFSAFALFVGYRFGIIDETSISDRNATKREVLVGTGILLATFAVCRFLLQIHWAQTLSLCVVYATVLNAPLVKLVFGDPRPQRQAPRRRQTAYPRPSPPHTPVTPVQRLRGTIFELRKWRHSRWLAAVVMFVLGLVGGGALASILVFIGLFAGEKHAGVAIVIGGAVGLLAGIVFGVFTAWRILRTPHAATRSTHTV